MIFFFCFVICFVPKKVELPDYDEIVISVLKREPNNEILIELTDREKAELYVLLEDIKGIYMPEVFAGYIINRGGTMYEISIDTKKEGSDCNLRFCIIIGFRGQPEHASYRYLLKGSYKFIINADDLADFLKSL